MNQVRAFSTSKYEFLMKHSSCILEMISSGKDDNELKNMKQEILLSLLDYLTISKYNNTLGEVYKDIENEQNRFEQMIESLEENLSFKGMRNAYLEINKILNILKLTITDINADDEEKMIHSWNAIAMYQEFNEVQKKQSKEVTYGKHYK